MPANAFKCFVIYDPRWASQWRHFLAHLTMTLTMTAGGSSLSHSPPQCAHYMQFLMQLTWLNLWLSRHPSKPTPRTASPPSLSGWLPVPWRASCFVMCVICSLFDYENENDFVAVLLFVVCQRADF